MTLVTLVRLSKMTPKWGWYRVIAVVLLFLRHVQGIAPGSDTSLIYFAAFEDRMLPGATHRLSPPLQISISYCADICRLSAILASNSLLSTLELDFRQLVREDSDVINGTSVCRGFMYIRSSSVCIHVKGQLDERWDVFADLKQAKDTIYYEHSKDSKNLFESYKNSILGDKDAYQRVINNVTMEACAGECTLSSGASCNSFAYSKNMSTCGLSKIIASNVSGLMPVEEYSYFLYNGNWPCNVTLNYKYEPRVIASQSYPYVNANNVTCHFTIIAPPSQMVVLHVRKFFITSRECKPEMNSVTIFETNNANATESRIKEGNEIGKLCSEDQISDNLVLSSSTDVYVVIRQSLDAMATRITYHFANASSCTVNPCMNAGSCREDHNASYRCYCQPGYTGLNCQSRLSVCDSKPCLFGGQCIATEDSFLCQCPRGLTGTICDYFTGACYSGPCYNNGTCAPLGSSYTCVCQRGFTGRRCEYDINECFSSPCVHGKCIDHLNRYECECDDAFDGRNCDQDKTLSHCDVFNCRFGTCAFNATGKFCQCFPGFKGDTCNDDIDDCSGNPCAHGSCVDHVNSFECKCHTGFVGKHCDIPSDDPCRYNPCRKGHCSFKNGSFECKCDPGFTGSQCETPLTKCDYMCTNGFCLNRFEFEPTCFCFEGFMGQYCEERCTNGKCPSHHEMNSTSFNPNRSSNIFTSNNAVTKVDINTVSLPLKPTISVDDIILKSSMQSQFEIPASQSDLTRIETMTILGGSSSPEKPRTQVLTYDQNPVISHIDTTPDTYITERQSYGGNAHVQSSAHILEPNLMLTSTHTVYSHSYKSESLKATDISASKSDMITSSKLLWSVKTLDHTDNVVTILTTPYTFKTSTEIAPTPVTGTDDAYTDYNQNIVETINVTHITSISTTTFPDSFSNRNQDLKMQSRMTDAEIGSFTAIPKSVNVVPDDGSKGHPMLYTIYSMNVAVPNYTDFASTEPQLHTTEYKTTINAQPPLASTQATSQGTFNQDPLTNTSLSINTLKATQTLPSQEYLSETYELQMDDSLSVSSVNINRVSKEALPSYEVMSYSVGESRSASYTLPQMALDGQEIVHTNYNDKIIEPSVNIPKTNSLQFQTGSTYNNSTDSEHIIYPSSQSYIPFEGDMISSASFLARYSSSTFTDMSPANSKKSESSSSQFLNTINMTSSNHLSSLDYMTRIKYTIPYMNHVIEVKETMYTMANTIDPSPSDSQIYTNAFLGKPATIPEPGVELPIAFTIQQTGSLLLTTQPILTIQNMPSVYTSFDRKLNSYNTSSFKYKLYKSTIEDSSTTKKTESVNPSVTLSTPQTLKSIHSAGRPVWEVTVSSQHEYLITDKNCDTTERYLISGTVSVSDLRTQSIYSSDYQPFGAMPADVETPERADFLYTSQGISSGSSTVSLIRGYHTINKNPLSNINPIISTRFEDSQTFILSEIPAIASIEAIAVQSERISTNVHTKIADEIITFSQSYSIHDHSSLYDTIQSSYDAFRVGTSQRVTTLSLDTYENIRKSNVSASLVHRSQVQKADYNCNIGDIDCRKTTDLPTETSQQIPHSVANFDSNKAIRFTNISDDESGITDTGEDMSDLVKIESVLLGTLFLVLVIVVVGGACVMYRQRHRGAVYLGSQEPPVWNNTFPVSGRQQDTALKKRCSSRDIHKDYMQGNHITTPAVANGYYRRGYEDLSPDDDADDESSASKSSIDGYSTGVMPVVRIGKPVSGQIVSNGLPHVSHRKAHPGTDHYVTTPVIRIQKPEPGQIVSYGTTLKESKYRKQRQRSRPPVYSKPIRRMCSDDSSEHTSSEQEDCIYSVPYLSRQPNRSADDKSQIHYDVIETPVVMISKPVPGQLITWDSRNYDDSAYGGQQLSVENHTIGHDSKGDDNPADQRSLKEISPNKETPLHPVRLESQTAPNSVPHSTCSSNPFFKQNDGSLGLRLSNTYHRWSEGDLDDLLDEMMESENFNPYSRSRDTNAVHIISRVEFGKSEA